MFKYTKSISELSHFIIKNYCLNFDLAIDCTLGNGGDCNFLKDNFKNVLAFDIQEEAVLNYKKNNFSNVKVILDSHSNVNTYVENLKADCIMFNLGFLPGGNKNITTKKETSLEAIKKCLDILKPNGILTIALYWGHDEGMNEGNAILNFITSLEKSKFGVMHHKILNRRNAPSLLVIEKQ